ncbi:RNase H family protein [Microlunatus flavus]|uniref:ribonuclease H n=1 Tax=Microlunatus flavus TaxID=1036181 RepID=A0A1H9LYU0_9ACTN|nr:RNase H family protein [Microlunatus flavus]SER16489.1 ribonuclease HI [Microlunatus flavus]
MTITAAADGSALGNPGPAGWAWYVDEDHWASGGWPRGTNNMGELKAVLDLLHQTAHLDDDLLVYCDSLYVINTVTQWMKGWKRKGWRKKDGKPVLNVELVKGLDQALVDRANTDVRFEWVKGHAGHPLNEAADRLAVAASTAFREHREPDAGPGFPGATPVPEPEVEAVPADDDLFSVSSGGTAPAVPSAPTRDVRADDLPAAGTELDDVVDLERALLSDRVRSDRSAVDALLDPAWSEVGASGRLWSRDEVLSTITPLDDAELEVLSVETLAPDVVLLVWRSRVSGRAALRSSVWVRSGGRWRQRFHQGTLEGGGRAR